MNLENLNLLVSLYLSKDPRTMVVSKGPMDDVVDETLYSHGSFYIKIERGDHGRVKAAWDRKTVADFLDTIISVAGHHDGLQRISYKSEEDILKTTQLTAAEIDYMVSLIQKKIIYMPANPMEIHTNSLAMPAKVYGILYRKGIDNVRRLYNAYCYGNIKTIPGIGPNAMKEIRNALCFIEETFKIHLDGIHVDDGNPTYIISTFNLSVVDEPKFSIDVEPIEYSELDKYQNLVVGQMTDKHIAVIERKLKRTLQQTHKVLSFHKGDQVVLAKMGNPAFTTKVDFYLVTIK